MKRVLITGVTSLHGWPLYKTLSEQLGPEQVLGICPPKTKMAQFPLGNVRPCCINDIAGLTEAFTLFRPTHIIHAAGMCDLDVCELWPSLAYQRNVEGTRNIAQLSRDCHVMQISTDLAFSGNHPPPRGYAEDHPPDPPSMIGKTFIEAESIIEQLPHALIVRKGLPMGDSISGRKGPIDYLAYRFRRGKPLTPFLRRIALCPLRRRPHHRFTPIVGARNDRALPLWRSQTHEPIRHRAPPHRDAQLRPHLPHPASRFEDPDDLPRIGDVALDSRRAYALTGFTPKAWP